MTAYDYGSVMHYGRTSFALNSSGPTIVPTQNSSAFIGQRVQLSPIDILEIQRYYGCVAMPPTTTSTTSTSTSATTATATSATTMSATTTTSTTGNTGVRDALQSTLKFYVTCLISIINVKKAA